MFKKGMIMFFVAALMVIGFSIQAQEENPAVARIKDMVTGTGQMMQEMSRVLMDNGQFMADKGEQYNDEELRQRGDEMQDKGKELEGLLESITQDTCRMMQ